MGAPPQSLYNVQIFSEHEEQEGFDCKKLLRIFSPTAFEWGIFTQEFPYAL